MRGARNHHAAVLKRLPHGVEHIARKFEQFVEEEHTAMRQRDFAGARAAPDTSIS